MGKKYLKPLMAAVFLILGFISPSRAEEAVYSFLPKAKEGTVKFFVSWENPRSLVENLMGSSFKDEEKAEITGQIPQIKEGAVVISFKKEDKYPAFFGAFRPIEGSDPKEVLEAIAALISQEGDLPLTVGDYQGEIRDGLDPLASLRSDGKILALSGLWKGDGKTVLLARTDLELNSMLDVIRDSFLSFVPGEGFKAHSPVYVEFTVPNSILRDLAAEFGVQAANSEDLKGYLDAQSSPEEVKISWSSNIQDLLADKYLCKVLEPLGENLPLSGGRILGFAAARLARIDLDLVLKLLSEDVMTKEDFDLQIQQITDVTGLTAHDLLDLLESRVSLVLGGKTRSPLGEVPGLFLQIEPKDKGSLSKLASALSNLGETIESFGFEELEMPGWTKAYAMAEPLGALLAVGESRAVFGALNHREIGAPAVLPDSLKNALEGDSGFLGALSIPQIKDAFDEFQDEDVKSMVGPYFEKLSHIDLIKLKLLSLSEGNLTFKMAK